MSRLVATACLFVSASAFAEPMLFLRVDQSGGLDRGEVGAAYSLEAGRAVVAIEGSAERGDAFRGATHRLTVAYGVLDWLGVGVEQSVKQTASDELRLGVLVPEARVRLGRMGLPVEGLDAFVQGRLRVTAERPSSVVGGLVLDRELRDDVFATARLGFEGTVGGSVPEYGIRSELGVAFMAGVSWCLSAEAWGNTRWRDRSSESDYHAGPALQLRWRALRVGLQLGMGVKSRTRLLVLDGVAAARVAVAF